MKRGQAGLGGLLALQILSDFRIVAVLVIALLIFIFGGLGVINQLFAPFGINLINGAVSGIMQPIAMLIALYLIFLLLSLLGKGIGNKHKQYVSSETLVVFLGIILFLFHYGVTGNLYAVASNSPANYVNFIDMKSWLIGLAVGGAGIYFVDNNILKRRR